MVPADWKHPKNKNGSYAPLYGRSFSVDSARYAEGVAQWNKGFCEHFGKDGEWVQREGDELTMNYEEWSGKAPEEADYMPDFPASERTHFQMYEDTTEGTPISPVMETPEALAHWLADNGASAFGDMTATYDEWLETIKRGFACGLLITGNVMQSGVSGLATPTRKK